ncbi:MAG: porin, partial [Acidobacteriaceae bacterium]
MSLIPSLFVRLNRNALMFSTLVFALLFISLHATAQSQDSAAPDASSGGAVAPPADNAAILRELDAMRQRIAELEAQLKARGGAPADAAAITAAELATAREHLLPVPAANSSQAAGATVSSLVPATTLASTKTPEPAPPVDKVTPFADAWWGWLNGNPRTIDCPLCTKYFTPEIRVDTNYNLDLNHPADDTIGGSSEVFRAQEMQLEQMGVGGDLLIDHVHARLMTQLGMYSVTTPRNDASAARG